MNALERTVSDLPFTACTALAALAGSFAVTGWSARFVLVPIDQFVIDNTPERLVTWAILTFGELAHVFHVALALVIGCCLLVGFATLGREVGRWREDAFLGTLVATVLTCAFVLTLTDSFASAVAAAVPFAVVLSIPTFRVTQSSQARSRRDVLTLVGGVVALSGLSILSGRRSDPLETTDPLPDQDAHEELLSAAEVRNLAVDGLGSLVTDVEDFYTVDIASVPPSIDPDRWVLDVTGAVDRDVAITYDDLLEHEPERRFVTLRCIGEPLNGDLIDTALWTCVPVAPLLEEATPGGDCECVMVHAADGYYERFPTDALRRSFLAYGMNGRTLPASNGSPVRLLVPGHWGKINVKWITEIEVLEEPAEGYWQQRGWHGSGPVETVAKLSVVNRLEDGRIQVAGHAYAGTRGIERVEVSVDDGESWTGATLSEPMPTVQDGRDGGDSEGENGNDSADVWRQWEHTLESVPEDGREVVVRATDGDGAVQSAEESGAFPSGPSGWVRVTI